MQLQRSAKKHTPTLFVYDNNALLPCNVINDYEYYYWLYCADYNSRRQEYEYKAL